MSRRARALLVYELAGAIFMILAGSALHFVFGWTGGWRPVALVAAVNESVWEHLKLAFWPGLLWAALQRKWLSISRHDALAVKGVTLALTAALIVVIFESYTSILGRNLLVLDIGTFALAILAGQMLSAWLMVHRPRKPWLIRFGLALLAVQIAAYGSFTFFPPDHGIFVDSRTGLRGLPPG